jgi:ATP-dependent protease ClpP protease subunit
MAKANESLEDLLMMGGEQKGIIRTITQQMHTHLVFIDEDITSPSNYRDVIHCLATCGENDDVNILLNSSGGRTDSAWAIIEAMKGCRGTVCVTVLGAAYSAASMVACMADECYYTDSSEMMQHTAHYGSINTVPNVKTQVDFTTRQMNKLLDTCYKGFLTDKELEELKNGKEFWFSSEESQTRMLKRYRYLSGLNKTKKPKKETKDVDTTMPEV